MSVKPTQIHLKKDRRDTASEGSGILYLFIHLLNHWAVMTPVSKEEALKAKSKNSELYRPIPLLSDWAH